MKAISLFKTVCSGCSPSGKYCNILFMLFIFSSVELPVADRCYFSLQASTVKLKICYFFVKYL